MSVYKRKSLFCCPLQQHPLGVLGHISNRKLLLLEVLFPGYQLVTALQLVSDWDNSRAVPEVPLLPGEVGVSPECWQWVLCWSTRDPFPPQPLCCWDTHGAARVLLPHGDSARVFYCQQSKCSNSPWARRDKDDPPGMSDVIISCFHMAPYSLLYLKYVSQTVQILLVIL